MTSCTPGQANSAFIGCKISISLQFTSSASAIKFYQNFLRNDLRHRLASRGHGMVCADIAPVSRHHVPRLPQERHLLFRGVTYPAGRLGLSWPLSPRFKYIPLRLAAPRRQLSESAEPTEVVGAYVVGGAYGLPSRDFRAVWSRKSDRHPRRPISCGAAHSPAPHHRNSQSHRLQ